MIKHIHSHLHCNNYTVEQIPGMTMLELIMLLQNRVNELISQGNTLEESYLYLLNEGLAKEVILKLQEWFEDGTLEGILSEGVLNALGIFRNKELNVKEYGAIGDGVNDDTLAIQSALNVGKEKGVNVYVPEGVYLISQPLVIFSDSKLTLSENATIRRKEKGGMLQNCYVGGIEQYSNITVEGGTWDMDNNHVTYSGGVHFTFGNAQNIFFKNITFLNNHGNHSIDFGGCENVVIENCIFKGFIADPLDTSRNYVEAIQIGEFTKLGLPSFGGTFNNKPCNLVTITNCKFVPGEGAYNNSHPCGVGHHYSDNYGFTENIIINGCLFEGNSYSGIRPYGWKNVNIDNNNFINCKEGIHLTNIEKEGHTQIPNINSVECENIVITNNKFNNLNYGVWCKGKSIVDDTTKNAIAKNIILSNNIFELCGECVLLELSKDVILNSNTVNKCNRFVSVKGCEKIVLSSNITDSLLYEMYYSSKFVGVGYNYVNKFITIENNKVSSCGRTGINSNATLNFIITNNIIDKSCIETVNTRSTIFVGDGCETGVVSSNIVTLSTNKYGCEITSSCKEIEDANNLCKGNLGGLINSST